MLRNRKKVLKWAFSPIPSQSAIKTAAADEIPTNFPALSQRIKRNAAKLTGPVLLTWIARHANIGGNETADKLAKEGAANATNDDNARETYRVSCSEAKSRLQCNAVKKWRMRWTRQNTGRSYQQVINPKRKLRRTYCRKVEVKVNRLILQHTNLEEDKHKMLPLAQTSPACECGAETGDVEHYLLRCTKFDTQREEMVDAIHAGYQLTHTDPSEQVYDAQTILGLNTNLVAEMHSIIATALSRFITASKKSI